MYVYLQVSQPQAYQYGEEDLKIWQSEKDGTYAENY